MAVLPLLPGNPTIRGKSLFGARVAISSEEQVTADAEFYWGLETGTLRPITYELRSTTFA